MATAAISVGFKIEDMGEGLKNLIIEAGDLKNLLSSAVVEAKALDSAFIDSAATATTFDSLSKTVGELRGVMAGLTAAYTKQAEVETKLATNMRNTMNARQEDIQSIKDLCSAEQQIGVIGDEVQLAGAQELATYLTKKDALRRLIPVMNDMVAQQYGLNVSQENAAQIATMLGKVMEGQTGALKRYGYSFDETQEAILKYGTEAEKAAVLASVVGASVGGMNEAMRETPTGQLQAVKNEIGDLKEVVGGLASSIAPDLEMSAQFVIATTGAVQFGTAIRSASKSLGVLTTAKKLATVVSNLYRKSINATSLALLYPLNKYSHRYHVGHCLEMRQIHLLYHPCHSRWS